MAIICQKIFFLGSVLNKEERETKNWPICKSIRFHHLANFCFFCDRCVVCTFYLSPFLTAQDWKMSDHVSLKSRRHRSTEIKWGKKVISKVFFSLSLSKNLNCLQFDIRNIHHRCLFLEKRVVGSDSLLKVSSPLVSLLFSESMNFLLCCAARYPSVMTTSWGPTVQDIRDLRKVWL